MLCEKKAFLTWIREFKLVCDTFDGKGVRSGKKTKKGVGRGEDTTSQVSLHLKLVTATANVSAL